MITLSSKVEVLAAGEVRPVAAQGAVFSCSSATAPFDLSVDGGPYIPMQTGYAIDNRPQQFTSLILRNPGAATITVCFYVTNCTVSFATNFNPATYAKGSGLIALQPNTPRTFSGLDGNCIRKQIIINNLQGANAVFVQDGNGNFLCAIAADSLWTVEVGGPIAIINPGASAQNICVGEIFYAGS